MRRSIRLQSGARYVLGWAALVCSASCGPSRLFPIHVFDAAISPAADGSPEAADRDASTEPAADVPPDLPVLTTCPPTTLVGYANETPGTSGGEGGDIVTATTFDELTTYAADPRPLVIQLASMIQVTGDAIQVRVQSNKTIRGAAAGAGLSGAGLNVTDVDNVIIQNLTISKARITDAVSINKSTHVWVDHCDFSSDLTMAKGTYDGLIDITHAADWITVSWNVFHDHYNTTVVGHSIAPDAVLEDPGHLTVTFHHNHYVNTPNNTPRVRFGSVHVFNNLFETVNNAIASVMNARVFVERNVFQNVKYPILTHYEDPIDGFVNEKDNLYDSASVPNPPVSLNPTTWAPSYTYESDPNYMVQPYVTKCAGPRF